MTYGLTNKTTGHDDSLQPPFWTTKSIRRSSEQTEVALVEKLEKTSSQNTALNQTKSPKSCEQAVTYCMCNWM